jgi:hypothetical protein
VESLDSTKTLLIYVLSIPETRGLELFPRAHGSDANHNAVQRTVPTVRDTPVVRTAPNIGAIKTKKGTWYRLPNICHWKVALKRMKVVNTTTV